MFVGGEMNWTFLHVFSLIFLVPLIFSLITLTIRSPSIDQYELSYSVDIQINNTCPLKREWNGTFLFHSTSPTTINQTKRCLFPSKHPSSIICENLTYGIDSIPQSIIEICFFRKLRCSLYDRWISSLWNTKCQFSDDKRTFR